MKKQPKDIRSTLQLVEDSIKHCDRIDYIHNIEPDISACPSDEITKKKWKGKEKDNTTRDTISSPPPPVIIEQFIDDMSHPNPPETKKRKRSPNQKTKFGLCLATFPQVLAAQCLSALDPKFNFQTWAEDASAPDTIQDLGVTKSVIVPIYEAYILPPINLMKSNSELVMHFKERAARYEDITPAQQIYENIQTLFLQGLVTHGLVVDAKVEQTGQTCFVTKLAPKESQRIVIAEFYQHNNITSPDLPFECYPNPTQFAMSGKYADICTAVWYLLNLEFIIGKNVLDWVQKRTKKDPEFRSKNTNGDIVREFLRINENAMKKIFNDVVFYLSIVERENKHRVTKLRKIQSATKNGQ